MKTVRESIKLFFEGYEKGGNLLDLQLIDTQYADTFIFADPLGSQAVVKEKFLEALPKRKGFFQMVGHQSTKIVSLEETPLDEGYVMVKAGFLMQFQKEAMKLELTSTFILQIQNEIPRIILQIEHENLQRALQEKGLLPPS